MVVTDGSFFKIEDSDTAFYIRDDDWRKQVRQCTYGELRADNSGKTRVKIPIDEEISIIKFFRYFDKSGRTRFSAKLKDDDRKILMITKKEFNPLIHNIVDTPEEIKHREANITDMIKSAKAPGFNTSKVRTSGSRGSMFHNNRLDEGAMGDLLDKGLEGAKHRAEDREKILGKGKAFSNRAYGRRIRNGKGKRH
jgi:hypothetical protein